jgi:hypothetical protein
MMSKEQIMAIREIAGAIIETVKASEPFGAPGGVMYAALMAHGCSLNQFESIMGGLVRAKLLTKAGDLYHVAKVVVA